MPAGKEREKSTGEKPVGGKLELGGIWLGLDGGTRKREEEQIKIVPFL